MIAKSLGMVKDIGGDPDGSKYGLLVSVYFIGYAPFSESLHPLCIDKQWCLSLYWPSGPT